MDMRNFEQCRTMTKSPSWTFLDVFRWKIFPERFGGGRLYARGFKDSWVKKHSLLIRSTALRFKLPPELLAGVCWIEVGGDPNIIDRFAFEVRVIDWSGPAYIDRNFTVTSPPAKTSFGFVSVQLRTAAKTIGLNADQMSKSELRSLSSALKKIPIISNLRLCTYANLPTMTSYPLGSV